VWVDETEADSCGPGVKFNIFIRSGCNGASELGGVHCIKQVLDNGAKSTVIKKSECRTGLIRRLMVDINGKDNVVLFLIFYLMHISFRHSVSHGSCSHRVCLQS